MNMLDAITDPDAAQVYVNQQVLKYAVQRQIFCQATGQVLDQRRAVLVTLTNTSTTPPAHRSVILTATAYDKRKDSFLAAVKERPAIKLEVLDGRELFKRNRKKAQTP